MSQKVNNPQPTEMPSNGSLNYARNRKENQITWLFLGLIIIVGGAIRIIHIINIDFPLNDGGFFYQMMTDLLESNFKIPKFTSYNHSEIPFAYPPLGLYIGGLVFKFTGIPLIDVIRILPSFISIMTIPAFYILALKLLNDRITILAATFGFAVLPTSFDWLIVGGGITRSFGYLFAIMTLTFFIQMLRESSVKNTFLTAIFASLTLLSHLGTTWFALYSSVIILIHTKGKSTDWIKVTAISIFGILILTSPWWMTVLKNHGIATLFNPFQTESISIASIITPLTFLFTNEPFLPILAFCGIIGLILCLCEKKIFFPIWLFLVFIFEPRLGPTYSVIPMSILIGIGINELMIKFFDNDILEKQSRYHRNLSVGVLAFLSIYIILSAYLGIEYDHVTSEQRTAMEWIKNNTPKSSQFLILTGTSAYGIDPVSEWFPTISNRTNLTTPQGHEWLADKEFLKRIQLHKGLQEAYNSCETREFSCIIDWANEENIKFTNIYVPNEVIYQPAFSDDFEIIYDGPGGRVIVRR